MKTMNIQIERTPRTVQCAGHSIQVEALSIRLPFACKPTDLGQLGGCDQHKVYITETRQLTTAEFDAFTRNLLAPRDWLRGKGGGGGGGYLCIEVTAPGRPYLYVNPEGGDYARYVARLG
ncbi:hypothetical protein [Xanthomonas albilineans]|uniref:hypothetical protein n=1 Tax=Xanthomonas albilineans TaxID=29447 RepID=UPI0005F357EA|nr:hypothetical protein [Xanthomonas albilineans]